MIIPNGGGDWVFAVIYIPSPDLSDYLKQRASNVGCSLLVLPVYNISRLYADNLLTEFTYKFEPIFAQDGKAKILYCHDADGAILLLIEDL